jgi:hypothetical protein
MPRVKHSHALATTSVLLALVCCVGCNLCKDEIVDKSSAPQGSLTAVTRTRDCGATTTETMWVSIQGNPDRKDVVGEHVFVLKRIHRLHVVWKDKDTLVIDCRDCALDEIRLQVAKLGSTRILYE